VKKVSEDFQIVDNFTFGEFLESS